MNCYNAIFAFVINFLLYSSITSANKNEDWTFPEGFLIGTATSAYQVEGAWNISGKSESVWDRFAHTPGKVVKGETGDIACDSYHRYKEDVKFLKLIGVDYYRFSMSWTRILPKGYANEINEDGIRYYHALLDELEKNNIQPFVTLYHWDHPQLFEEMGGWTNEIMVDLFGDYARVIFREFGHRVKMFSTINQPSILCEFGYLSGFLAPGKKLGKHGEYLCAHNVLKAHARAYHIYNDEFRAEQKGKVSIVLKCDHYYPKYKNDTLSAELAFQFNCGLYGHPIYSKEGDYPELVKNRVEEVSKLENYTTTKLPAFSQKWIDYIRGSADYLSLNHYTAQLVEPASKMNNQIYENDAGLTYSFDPNWPATAENRNKIVPQAFTDILIKVKEEYGNPDVYIMENGVASENTLNDNSRMEFFSAYMKAMLTAIKQYNCSVKAYTIWSFLDNFEWLRGYTRKYGIVRVNFDHPNRTRDLKLSGFWFSRVLKTRKLQTTFM